MTVCEYCLATLFNQIRWSSGQAKTHHSSLPAWKRSVNNPCTICTLLLENVRTAYRNRRLAGSGDAKRRRLSTNGTQIDKERDRRIRERAVEDSLIDWVTDHENEIEAALPVYDVLYEDAGGRDAWILKFKPRLGLEDDVKLCKQDFFVYNAEYDERDEQTIELEDSTKSETTFLQIQKWMQDCRHHNRCQYLHKPRTDDDYAPLRLIDLGGKSSDKIKLIKTDRETAQYHPYATLSYRWGYPPPDTALLTEENYAGLRREILPSTLPQTFQDALIVTRRLGVRYLWIDALCLMQRDRKEWISEALKMRYVYTYAHVNLAAASSDNSEQGLFRHRRPGGVPPSTVEVCWAHHHQRRTACHVVRADFWKGELLAEPLYLRGWVLQERMLAPRVLHFHRRQVLWQCPSLTASERVPGGLSRIVDDERREELRWRQLMNRERVFEYSVSQKVDLHGIWRFIVDRYTRCELTKREDRLMALAGVAQRMKEAFDDEKYIAGLWGRDLVEQLAWRVVEFWPPQDEVSYVAPSWTWISADGVVKVPSRVEHEWEYRMSIPKDGVRVTFEDTNDDAGRVHFGTLTAETQLYRLKFRAETLQQPEWDWVKETMDGGRGSWCRFYPDAPIDPGLSDRDMGGDRDLRLHLFSGDLGYQVECTAAMLVYEQGEHNRQSYSGYALALEHGRLGHAEIFSRIGLIEFHGLDGDLWTELYNQRMRRKKDDGDVAPSDDRPDDTHFISIV